MVTRAISRVPLPIFPKKETSLGEPLTLVHSRRVRCIAGGGGDGMISFLRGYRHPFGGPDGGDGGNGGHVIFRASSRVSDLSHVRSEIRAKRGAFGMSKSMTGKSADHVEVEVPVGTTFRDTVSGQLYCELDRLNQSFVAARGGAGGHGNQFFVSNSVRKPFKAEVGGEGEETIAFAGFVGFPNAGKSSLLRAISRARPKVASYPFTTLRPHVGIVHYDDYQQVSEPLKHKDEVSFDIVPMADIPGIIEGAHRDVGLGHSFLSHINRCRLLLFVIDVSLGECREQYLTLRNEVRLFSNSLAEKPSAILLNKIDLIDQDTLSSSKLELPADEVFPVSAKRRDGLVQFLQFLRQTFDR